MLSPCGHKPMVDRTHPSTSFSADIIGKLISYLPIYPLFGVKRLQLLIIEHIDGGEDRRGEEQALTGALQDGSQHTPTTRGSC